MRVGNSGDTAATEREREGSGWGGLGRLGPRQWGLLLVCLAALGYCGLTFKGMLDRRRELATTRMQPPPEVLEARRQRGSPFAPGLTREQRREAMKHYGRDFWQRTTEQQKLEIIRGYFPELIKDLELTPEQQGPVQQILAGTAAAILPLWDGWWNPGFNKGGALLRTWLIAAQGRQQLEPLLNAEQKKKLDSRLEHLRASTTPGSPAAGH